MGFVMSSFVRTFKMIFLSVCCSFIALILQMMLSQNFTFLHVMSLLLFLGTIGVDTYRFSSLYFGIRDSLLGLYIPFLLSLGINILGYFFFSESLYNYLFLPLRAFETLGFQSIHSVLLSNACWFVVIVTMSQIGSMHPIEMEDDYFNQANS